MPPDFLPTNLIDDFTVLTKKIVEVYKPGRLVKKSGSQTLKYAGKEEARVQPCQCYQGKALSVTVRGEYLFQDIEKAALDVAKANWKLDSGYYPKKYDHPPLDQNVNTIGEICRIVYEALHFDSKRRHGLLVVSGATKSLKTKLLLGIIHLYLEQCMRDWLQDPKHVRRPHLVTCEDDIEKEFHRLDELVPLENVYLPNVAYPAEAGLWLTKLLAPDYTPRHIPTDVKSLSRAVEDALRMTPAVFYGGEIRRENDWPDLYRLAQSHMVMVTTHASSLINTFAVLLNHLNVKSGAERAELADAIFGVVHMRATELEKRGAVVPSCWVNSPVSVATFTSDGLASIVPSFSTDLKGPDVPYCLGRRAFAVNLLEFAGKNGRTQGHREFLQSMAAWDLRGE